MQYVKPPRLANYMWDRRRALWVGTKASGPWTPNSIPGIVEYWDMSETSLITAPGGVTSAVTGHKSVYTLTQSSVGKRPTSASRTINGLNALDLNGSSMWMGVNITNIAQPYTFLAVYQNDTTANDQRVVDTAGRGLYDAAFNSSSGKRVMYAGSVVAGASAGSTSAEQVVVTLNGASSQTWLNGVSEITGNPGTNATGATFFMGADPSELGLFDGAIAFLALISGTMSSGDRTSWNTWCARWGL